MIIKRQICLLVSFFSIVSSGCSYKHYHDFSPQGVKETKSLYSVQDTKLISKTPSLDEYVLYALKKSSSLKASFELYQAAKEKPLQSSVLPEPKLSYGYFINSIETRTGPMKHRVGLAQPIPWFGKLTLKEQVASEEQRAAYYLFLAKKNKLVFEVIKAYYELAYLKEARNITKTNLELLKQWESVLASRYRSQTGTQADLIKVQLELGKLEDKLKELNDLKEPLAVHFNSLLNRSITAEVIVKRLEDIAVDEDVIKMLSLPKRDLRQILKKQNPELKLLEALLSAREKGIRLAKKDFYPDFALGADYTFIGNRFEAGSQSGEDALAAMFSISIPINISKYKAGLRESKYRRQAAKESLKAKSFELISKLARNVFEISDSERRVSLFMNTLVPKAQEVLESTYTAFEAGEASFLDLLDTERQMLEFQLMLLRSQADLAIYTSELRSLIGDYSEVKTESKGNQNEKTN